MKENIETIILKDEKNRTTSVNETDIKYIDFGQPKGMLLYKGDLYHFYKHEGVYELIKRNYETHITKPKNEPRNK